MTAPAPLLLGLLDDAALLSASAPDLSASVRDHRAHRSGSLGSCLAALVVADQQLGELGRIAGPPELSVLAVNTGGAGGLAALGRRNLPGVQVVAVQSALRDLDDLAGNAARVVSAARELPESVEVYVELPDAAGWQRAVEVVEAAGLSAAVRAASLIGQRQGGPSDVALVEQLSGLVEADLPFAVAGWDRSLAGLLLAVHGLVDGADGADVVDLLSAPGAASVVAGWDDQDAARVRRRLRRVQCPDLASATAELGPLLPVP